MFTPCVWLVAHPVLILQVAFGLADLSTHEELHERIVKKGGCKSLIQLLMKSSDNEAQRFSALALANIASAVFNRITMVQVRVTQPHTRARARTHMLLSPSPLLVHANMCSPYTLAHTI